VAGDHLVTSLDVRLQAAAEKALKDAVLRGRANGYTSDSGAAVAIVGLKTYTIDSKLVSGIYNRKTQKLKIKFEGEFPKSLDGSLEAMVNLPTEVEFEATRK
jgi:hypothetical protein